MKKLIKWYLKRIAYGITQKTKYDSNDNMTITTFIGHRDKKMETKILSNCTEETVMYVLQQQKMKARRLRRMFLKNKYPKLFK